MNRAGLVIISLAVLTVLIAIFKNHLFSPPYGVWATRVTTVLPKDHQKNPDLTIRVTADKRSWIYEILDKQGKVDLRYTSHFERYRVSRPLVLPRGKKIKLIFKSNDQTRIWYIKQIGMKIKVKKNADKVVWMRIESPGRYTDSCRELCVPRSERPVAEVHATSYYRFMSWYARQRKQAVPKKVAAIGSDAPLSADQAKQIGRRVYMQNCAACHQPSGLGIPRIYPALRRSKLINNHDSQSAALLQLLFNGKGAMPPFKRLTDSELAVVIYYISTFPGNLEILLQPKDIARARSQLKLK